MAAPEILMLVQESAYGVPVASPIVGTNSVFTRLAEGNAFSAVMAPVIVETPYGGGIDLSCDAQADHHTVTGSLSTFVYPSQAAIILNWALTRINAGQTLPWVTTEPVDDLVSMCAYHLIRTRSGTVKRLKYPGGKVAALEISCSRQDPRLKLKLDLVFQKESGNPIDGSADPLLAEFPLPAETDLPTGCYLFGESVGEFKWNASALTRYDSFNMKVQNMLDPQWYENHFVTTLGNHGRKTTVDSHLLFTVTPDLRTDLASVTSRALAMKFTKGGNSVKFDLNARNHQTKLPFDLPLGKEFFLPVSFSNKFDPTAATDLILTVV